MLGKIEGRQRRERQRMDGITGLMDMSFSKLWELVRTGKLGVLQFMGSQRVRHERVTELITEWGWMPWSLFCFVFFLIFSFKPTLSLFSFTLIKRLFSSSSLSAIRVVSSTYLRFLMFLLPILIPACNSSSLAFLMSAQCIG